MQENFNEDKARSNAPLQKDINSTSSVDAQEQNEYQQNIAILQDLQKCTHTAKLQLREQVAQNKYSDDVIKLAKDVYDNLLFSESNELVKTIKAGLCTQKQKDFLFKYKLGESEVCILEKKEENFIELHNEDKEEIFTLLWEITLFELHKIVQSVSAERKDTTMNIKKTSFNSSPFAQVGSAKSSKAYSTGQVSSASGANTVQNVSRGDTIQVSTEGLLRTEAYKVAQTSSDLRQHKIDSIKDKIASGTYIIDTKQLAFNLLKEEASLLL